MVRILAQRGEPRKGRGFGFVTLANEEMQQKAIAEMNGKTVEGREIAVKVAIDNPKLEAEAEAAEDKATEDAAAEDTAAEDTVAEDTAAEDKTAEDKAAEGPTHAISPLKEEEKIAETKSTTNGVVTPIIDPNTLAAAAAPTPTTTAA